MGLRNELFQALPYRLPAGDVTTLDVGVGCMRHGAPTCWQLMLEMATKSGGIGGHSRMRQVALEDQKAFHGQT